MKFKNLLIILLLISSFAIAQEVSNVGLAWAGNSVNTVVFRRNSVVSYKNAQYTSYYDSVGNVILAKRKLGSNNWTLKKTPYKGNYKDAHNSISIIIDGDGFLHISWDQHASKLRYAKSIAPNSLELGAELTMIGKNEAKATYPEFYKLKDGDLLFLYREGTSGQGNLVLNRYAVKTQKWERIHDNLIDGQGQRNAYWQACVDEQGVFHLSWVWREKSDVATNHDMSYAKSLDGGKTWLSSSKQVYTIPMNIANTKPILIIPQKSELINSTSMSTDEKGNPYIASYWRTQSSKIPQYQLIYLKNNEWKVQQVSDRKTPFSLSGVGTKRIPISRPQIVVNKKTVSVIFRDEERGNKVSAATNRNIDSEVWNITDLNNDDVGQWEPSYDTSLWQKKKQLHLFVQQTGQGDGEKTENIPAQMVKIIEEKPIK
jgi:hypothetical protein